MDGTRLQYLHCRAEQWDGAAGTTLVVVASLLSKSGLDGVLPNWRDINSTNWEVEELRQEGQDVLTQMAEVEHCEPVRPLGGGKAFLPYGRCDDSLVEQPVWGVHTVVAVEVPHEPSKYPIVSGRTGSELPVEGLCNRLRAGEGFPLEGDWDVWWGTLPLAAYLAQKRPVALGIGDAVTNRLQEGPSLVVLRFLANVPLDVPVQPLDVPVQQLDGRVEGVISAALISLRDVGSHNIGERAAVIPNITAGNVVIWLLR